MKSAETKVEKLQKVDERRSYSVAEIAVQWSFSLPAGELFFARLSAQHTPTVRLRHITFTAACMNEQQYSSWYIHVATARQRRCFASPLLTPAAAAAAAALNRVRPTDIDLHRTG